MTDDITARQWLEHGLAELRDQGLNCVCSAVERATHAMHAAGKKHDAEADIEPFIDALEALGRAVNAAGHRNIITYRDMIKLYEEAIANCE